MSNQTQDKLWTEEYLIARSEGVAAGWRSVIGGNSVFDLSRDVLRLLRSMKDAYEQRLAAVVAERDALRQQLADLQRKWDCVREADKYQAEMEANNE